MNQTPSSTSKIRGQLHRRLFGSCHTGHTGGLDILRAIGPGLLVTVGFIDPGNWASNMAAGSQFGYSLLWVVTLSTIMLIVLQHNAAHLGIVTGECLAESVTRHMPRFLSQVRAAHGPCRIGCDSHGRQTRRSHCPADAFGLATASGRGRCGRRIARHASYQFVHACRALDYRLCVADWVVLFIRDCSCACGLGERCGRLGRTHDSGGFAGHYRVGFGRRRDAA